MFLVIRSIRPARLAVVLTGEELDALRSGKVDDLLLVDVSTGIELSIEARPDEHTALLRTAELVWPDRHDGPPGVGAIGQPLARAAARAGRARAEAAYRDPTCPLAQCERCGTPYRGPALYCSLQCAEEDA